MARVFEFIDIWGYELYTINDPEDELPIPTNNQMISIGPMRTLVESVMVGSTTPDTPTVYRVLVHVSDGID